MTRARDLSRAVNNKMTVFKYTATANQTTFTGADGNGVTLAYDPNSIIVTYNGIILESVSEYTATNGTSVVLASGATVGAEVNILAFEDVAYSGVMPTTGGTFTGDVTFGSAVTVDGAFTSKGIDDNADATTIHIDTNENVSLDGAPPASSDNGNLTLKGASTLNWTTHQANIASNATFDSTWKYITTNYATLMTQSSGGFRFYTAGSDTAGNNISWNQKVTILNDGKVGIGINTPTAPLHVQTSDNNDLIRMTVSGNEMWAISGYSGAGSNDFLKMGIAGGTSAIELGETGIVRKPNNPIAVWGNNSGDQELHTGAWFTPTLAHVSFNVGNCYNNSNYRFTAPTTGRYHVWFSGEFTCTSATIWTYLCPLINGSTTANVNNKGNYFADFTTPQASYHQHAQTWFLDLDEGDYFYFASRGSGGSIKIKSHQELAFGAALIG